MKVISVGNHKGGTGKTATAVNVGAILAGAGWRVLLVDCDPQGSLTAACGQEAETGDMADVLTGAEPMGRILMRLGPGLTLAPSSLALAAAEMDIVSRPGRERTLQRSLASVASLFDLALIDCPPGLGLLVINALVAADAVLIPTQPQGADLRALTLFLTTIERTRAELNPSLTILGIVPTFCDRRFTHHGNAITAMQGAGLPVLDVVIGRSVRVAEAMAAGLPLAEYDPSNPQNTAYAALAEVITSWLESNPT